MTRNKKLWVSAVALALLQIPIIGASFFAPYHPTAQNRDAPSSPPTSVHFVDLQERFHMRPFVCRWIGDIGSSEPQRSHEDCSKTSSLRFFVRTETVYNGQVLRSSRHLFGTDGAEHVFLLGTDEYGRDQFSRLLYGGQTSLGAGLLATGLTLGLGLLLGCIAAHLGAWVDDVIMRAAALVMALPWIYP